MIENSRIDGLSDLPDCLLHHILSFVDTKSLIRTSILSQRWISVWKHVHVLNFIDSERDSDSESKLGFNYPFKRHVDRVLSLRSDSSSVTRVTVDFCAGKRMDFGYGITISVRHPYENMFTLDMAEDLFLNPS
ncbi:F-box/LRR-repeat protein At3g58930 [Linum grandiflorum]